MSDWNKSIVVRSLAIDLLVRVMLELYRNVKDCRFARIEKEIKLQRERES
jgi:hypothetical protein